MSVFLEIPVWETISPRSLSCEPLKWLRLILLKDRGPRIIRTVKCLGNSAKVVFLAVGERRAHCDLPRGWGRLSQHAGKPPIPSQKHRKCFAVSGAGAHAKDTVFSMTPKLGRA